VNARTFILLLAIGAAAVAGRPAAAQQTGRRAILVSLDGLSEQRLAEFTDSSSAPALWRAVRGGACADGVRNAFPTVTPAAHAAIWTGAYGNVNGIAAHRNGVLPLDSTTILQTTDGFSAASLRAEPLWISAARQGVSVFAHMATQGPQPPGYPLTGTETPAQRQALANARASAAATLARPNLSAVNGYNRLIAAARIVTADSSTTHAAAGWSHLATLKLDAHAAAPREVSWSFGTDGDSLHALFYAARADHGYARAVLSSTRDAAAGVTVRVAPVDSSIPRGRPLARYFSAPLRIAVRGGETFVYARLFDMAPDLSHFMLYVSEARVVEGNRPSLTARYDSAVGGMLGNGSDYLMLHGGFGPMVWQGGDGTAEWRYLETVELVTRQFERGSAWAWHTAHPTLQLDYLPYPDEALHTWLGYADPSTPGIAPDVRARAAHMLQRAYMLVDHRLATLRALAEEDRAHRTLLLVTADHGLRPTWQIFRPNVALRNAGLLTADSAGRIDLAHTDAAAPNEFWITVNRTSRRGGIVPPDSVNAILAHAEQALRDARDSSGAPIVTAVYRAVPNDSLGIGGPAGGDVYFGVRPGVFMSYDVRGPVIGAGKIQGEHGFPSVEHDMQPLFCAVDAGVVAHRFAAMRSVDIAPTVSDWLGVKPPANTVGTSRLADILRR
jgi:predicted AlkP superfamily phosphohydrolase/phosphomutase